MASASKIDDLLQCPICLEIFYDPKVLDCQHTYCANCLKVHLSASSRMFNNTLNAIECPVCRRRTNLVNNSIDSLPGNYIVRDIIERQYGTRTPERPAGYTQKIRDRIQKLQNGEKGKEEKEEEEETNYMDYIKPAAAALVGVLGGLLLAKAVKNNCKNDKKQDEH